MRVLVVEADPSVAQRIVDGLVRELIPVTAVASVEVPPREEADVTVIGLPDGDRHALCRALRAAEPGRRIVMLTPAGTEAQAVAALEAGADHVLPREGISGRELAARLRAVARRPGAAPIAAGQEALALGSLRVDRDGRRVLADGVDLALPATELELLLCLAAHPGRALPRERLVDQVWGDRPVDERTLDTVVKRLRARLGAEGERIETVRGVGYRLRA